jgi:hypothetical protein
MLLLGCAEKAENQAPDAGPADSGLPLNRTPPDPALAGLTLNGLAGETSIALAWGWASGQVAGVERWVIDWGEAGTGFPNTFEAGAKENESAVLEGLESGKTYELFVSGLTSSGQVAPEPDASGQRPEGALAQSIAITLTTSTPKLGAAREVATGALDSAQLLPISVGRSVLVYRSERNLIAASTTDRGMSFGPGLTVDSLVQGAHSAVDASRGIVVICYKKAEGLFVATSSDGGGSFQAKLLSADEGPGCSVAFALGAFLIAAESPGTSRVMVHRSEDGFAFTGPAVGAEVNNSGSCSPAIVADPVRRSVAGPEAEMVYLAWVQQRTSGSGGTDILVSSSRDGGRTFVSEGGHVVGLRVNDPVMSSESAPVLAVDRASGRLWAAWEDRKTTPLILLAASDDYCQTAPSGALSWAPGAELGRLWGHARVNPSMRVRGDGKLLVGFASGTEADLRSPYVTLFDISGDGGRGKLEAPQSGADVSLKLSSSLLASTAGATSELAGPSISSDAIGELVVWATNSKGIQGDLELVSSP